MRRLAQSPNHSIAEESHSSQVLYKSRRDILKQFGILSGVSLLAANPFLNAALAAQVTSAARTRRIVSVGGALTEIMYALHADSDLVAVDTTSNFPESAQKLPSVGYARTLSAEGLLALAPTQVIATEDAGPPAILRQITASGVPLTILAGNHRFEGLLERVKRIGDLTGRKAEAVSMMQTLQQDWARARAPILQRESSRESLRDPQTNLKPVRILFILAHSPSQIMVAGNDTSAQAMIGYVGAINSVAAPVSGETNKAFSGYKPLTPEAVIASQADVVLVTEQGLNASGGVESVLKLPGIEQTPAGRNRRVVALEAMFLLGFGPRLPAAVAALDGAINKAMRA